MWQIINKIGIVLVIDDNEEYFNCLVLCLTEQVIVVELVKIRPNVGMLE